MFIAKFGVYLKGIWGPFKNEKEAMVAFEKAYEKDTLSSWNEFDGYHDYYLIDKLPEFDGVSMTFDGYKKIQHKAKRKD